MNLSETNTGIEALPVPICHFPDYYGKCESCKRPALLWIEFHLADTPGFCEQCWRERLRASQTESEQDPIPAPLIEN